ncbi:agmatinase [Novosphingobium sp. SG751A]|uniref:agmatinase n=1 Tax=Novosphingobium sp. SG751A TaxID=2587000 RepID=UPI001555BE6A|nr:agmatinase [Novosphingobium sp. SG751A]NOW47643.1 agmatinase [Novosphingobium sp. SG751A]
MPFDLDELRRLYAGAGGGDMHDPHLREVAGLNFKDGDKRQWPFANPSTLLGAPYMPGGLNYELLRGLDVALIGVPMDLGVTNRPGARYGPRALRGVDRIGPYEHALRIAPMNMLRVADLGDVPMNSRYDLAGCHADIEAAYRTIARTRAVPLSVGGDHSITGSIMKGLAERSGPMGLVQIDAHCDTGGIYEGSRFHHSAPFREAVLAGVLDPRRCVQIGIRGGAAYLWEFSHASGMTVIHVEEVQERGIDWVIAKAREVVGDGPTYVSFDVDALDPAFAPGTGTPEVGGLSTREAIAILRGLAGIDIVGGDVVEVAPEYDHGTITAQAGAQMLFQLLCLVALRT